MTFTELKIKNWLLQALNTLDIKESTEIQKLAIPRILQGSDVIASAKTGKMNAEINIQGSGKTIAFAIPILQRIIVFV